MIPDDFIAQVLDRTDVLPLIEPYVKMKKVGQDWVGLCPFHKERTPSFTVTNRKQFYHCFGCGANGNAIGFLIEHVGMTFPEAVRSLADDAGMAMPDHSKEMLEEAQRQRQQNDVMESAAAFFRRSLRTTPQALAYFKGRELLGETVARFGLGFAPGGGALQAALPDDGTLLQQCGLTLVAEGTGEIVDRFHDRVMFPIRNARGKLIGFAGRVLHDREGAGGKYTNSPEGPLFQKRRELYGLAEAMASIKQMGYALVVEGYMDVLMLHQHKIMNAVAGMGTSFTIEQLAALFKITSKVVFCFDGDKAGIKASLRALDTLLPALTEGKSASFMLLPADEDPDDVVRNEGADGFLQRLEQAPTVLDFMFNELQKTHNTQSPEGKAAFVAAARERLSKVTSPLLRAAAAARLEEITHLDLGALRTALHRKSATPMVGAPPTATHLVLRYAVFAPEAAQEIVGLVVSETDNDAEALRAVLSWVKLEAPRSTEALLALASGSEVEDRLQAIATLKPDYSELDHPAELARAVEQYRKKAAGADQKAAELAAFRAKLAG